MNDFSRDELEVLAGARRAIEPSAQDAARVLHKARLAIGSGAAPVADVVRSGGSAKSATWGVLAKKVASWLAIGAVSAWLGYHAGFSQGEQRAREAGSAIFQSAGSQSAGSQSAMHAAPAPKPPHDDVAVASLPAVHDAPKLTDQAPIERSTEPRRRQKPAQPGLAPEAPEAPDVSAPIAPQPSASLDAEIKALRFVERALRNREPQAALARLAQLDREVPDGQMRQERAAARAMARCEAGALEGTPDHAQVMQRVLEFSQQYPASVYFARVRQTCLATIERDAATD